MIARNGTEALDLLNKQVPALVLLDIMMPDVDGYEICRRIKNRKTQIGKSCFMSAKTRRPIYKRGWR